METINEQQRCATCGTQWRVIVGPQGQLPVGYLTCPRCHPAESPWVLCAGCGEQMTSFGTRDADDRAICSACASPWWRRLAGYVAFPAVLAAAFGLGALVAWGGSFILPPAVAAILALVVVGFFGFHGFMAVAIWADCGANPAEVFWSGIVGMFGSGREE